MQASAIKLLFGILLLFGNVHFAQAQFNAKVAYVYSYVTNNAAREGIISRYNTSKASTLSKGMPNLHGMNGVDVGVRYKMEFVGVEAGFTTKNALLTAINKSSVKETSKFIMNSYYLGLQAYIGKMFVLGANIERSTLLVKFKAVDVSTSSTILENQFWSNQYYIMWEPNTQGYLSLAIKPYIQIPLASTNLYAWEQKMSNDANVEPSKLNEHFINFGISVIFYNGKHEKY